MAGAVRRSGRRKDPALAAHRREQILTEATRTFARRGYPDTDLQELADAIGIAKGTIYTYFRSKEKLFLAAVDRGMQAMSAYVRAAADRAADPLDRVANAIRAYLTFFKDHPDHAELLIIERAEFRDRKKPTYLEYREVNRTFWREVYTGLIRDGRVRDVPVTRILDGVGDLLYGTMFTNHFYGHNKPLKTQVEDVLDMVFHGILTPAERDSR